MSTVTGFFSAWQFSMMDLAVLVFLLIFALFCAQRGFVRAALGFLPTWVALIGTYFLYPTAAKMLRGTSLYVKLQNVIDKYINLQGLLSKNTFATQSELIQNIQIPEFLKTKLLENNNPVIYKVLNVEGIQGYINGFLANICINILSMILVFLILFIICWLILNALDLVAKLPVLSAVNHFFGFVIGIFRGVVWVWVLGIALTFFYYSTWAQPLVSQLNGSLLTLWLYNHNWLLFMILKVFT